MVAPRLALLLGSSCLLALTTPVECANKRKDRTPRRPHTGAPEDDETLNPTTQGPNEATDENKDTYFQDSTCLGVTITPYHDEGDVPAQTSLPIAHHSLLVIRAGGKEVWSDGERMELSAGILQRLNVEFSMRRADDDLKAASFSRERGDADKQPHVQGTYDVPTPKPNADEELATLLKKLKERERSWLKGILEQETMRFNSRDNIATPHKVPRLVVKYIKDTTRFWHYGYDQKAPYHCHSSTCHVQ